MQYIVLENSINENLTKAMPKLRGRVWTLDHPFPHSQGCKNCLGLKRPIKFAYIGVAAERKGFSLFLKTAEGIKNEYQDRVEFHAIGRLPGYYKSIKLPGMEVLSTKPGESGLSRKDFMSRLEAMHFVCLFFDKKYYQLSGSGVLLDAIAFEKPIICSDLQLFRDLQLEFGDIGYLCENQDYSEAIREINEAEDATKYEQQISNIRKIRDARSPKSLARKFRLLSESLNEDADFANY